MKKFIQSSVLFLLMATCSLTGKAQVGYQICLLDTSTGEPRANETVNVEVKLTNSEGSIIYSGIQTETTNDFGVLSLTIGNANTFNDVDFSKLPFYIEVSANGVMIGKTQMLSVPVAEAAKQIVPLDENLLLGTWIGTGTDDYGRSVYKTFIFKKGGTCDYYNSSESINVSYQYEIIGRVIYLFNGKETQGQGSTTMGLRTLLYSNAVIYITSEDQDEHKEHYDPIKSVTKQ